MSRPRLIALLLALVTLAVYLPVVGYDFVNCDDDVYITRNPMVLQGLNWAGLKWAFTTFHGANWHPLTWLSHQADCQFFQLHAGAHHFVNVLFHAANTALLFVLLRRLTGLTPPAVLVAALFAWHPLHVESVAWIAERKDVLSTFFALLALLSYAKYAQENHRRSLWHALVFFALGLLAKPMLVTLPFLLLLLDYWPLKRLCSSLSPSGERAGVRGQFSPALEPRSFQTLILEKLPFFALTAISCVVTFIAQRHGGAVITVQQLPLHFRLENAAVSVMLYLAKTFWPAKLALLYPYAAPSGSAVILAMAVLAVISVMVWIARNANRCWLMGWLWFLGTLVPVIGLVQVGAAAMADRYTYLPSIGLFSALAFGLYELSWGKKLFPFVTAFSLVACVIVTGRQLAFWRNSETLFRHSVEVTQNNDSAYIDLGQALDAGGKAAEALDAFRHALQINSGNYHIQSAAGDVLMKLGKPAEALAAYQAGINLAPDVSLLHTAAGRALAAGTNDTAALTEFSKAEQLDANDAAPHLEMAKIFFAQGHDTQASEELHNAVRAQSDDFHTLATVARYLAANTNATGRDPQSALLLAVKANDLSGSREPEVFDVLGMAFAATGDYTNAFLCASNALVAAHARKATNLGGLEQRLKLYQTGRPWLESFGGTNAPAK